MYLQDSCPIEKEIFSLDLNGNKAAYINLVDILTASTRLNGKLWSFKSIMHVIFSVQQLGDLVMHNMTPVIPHHEPTELVEI